MSAVALEAGLGRSRERERSIPDLVAALAREGVPVRAIGRVLMLTEMSVWPHIEAARRAGLVRTNPPLDWGHNGVERELRRQLAEAEEEIAALQRRAARPQEEDSKHLVLSMHLRLTRHEAMMLGALMSGRIMTKDALYGTLYADRIDGGPTHKIVDVWICRLRDKISRRGLVIETLWGQGYRLAEQSAAWLRELVAAAEGGALDALEPPVPYKGKDEGKLLPIGSVVSALLEYLLEQHQTGQHVETYSRIGDRLNCSRETVRVAAMQLSGKGLVILPGKGRSRSLKLTDKALRS